MRPTWPAASHGTAGHFGNLAFFDQYDGKFRLAPVYAFGHAYSGVNDWYAASPPQFSMSASLCQPPTFAWFWI